MGDAVNSNLVAQRDTNAQVCLQFMFSVKRAYLCCYGWYFLLLFVILFIFSFILSPVPQQLDVSLLSSITPF